MLYYLAEDVYEMGAGFLGTYRDQDVSPLEVTRRPIRRGVARRP